MNINLILDIIVLIFLALGCIIGAKKGLIYQILSLVSFVISFIAAKFFSKIIAIWGYTTFIKEKIELMISEKIVISISEEHLHLATPEKIKSTLSDVLNDIPNFISDMINLEKIDFSSMPLDSAAELGSALASIVIAPIIIIILSHILFVVLFIIFTILFKILIKATNIVKKIPLIKKANKWIGALLGIVIYGIILTIFIQVFGLLLTLNGADSFIGISEETIQSTYLFKIFYNIF